MEEVQIAEAPRKPHPLTSNKDGGEKENKEAGAEECISIPRDSLISPSPSELQQRDQSITSKESFSAKLNFSWTQNGLTTKEVEERREIYGYNEVATKQTPEYVKILRRYLGFIPLILVIAAVLSVSIPGVRDWLSFGMLIFLLNVMVWADYLADRNSRSAISAVEKLGAPECRVKRDGEYVSLKVRELIPGDIVALKAGGVVPADGRVVDRGEKLSLDESALTGESLPVTKRKGDELLSGAVVQCGEAHMLVTKIGADSFIGKTITLLGEAEKQGHLRYVLDRAVVVIAGIAALFALFLFFWLMFNEHWRYPWYVALKQSFVIVASVIPAAMPVITTTVLVVGAMQLSKENAIVRRLSAIEEAAGIQVLCSDKTGTLTKNILTLFRDDIVCEAGVSVEELLLMASLASTVQDPEPIDKAINQETNMEERTRYSVLRFIPFNPVDKKSVSTVKFPDGRIRRVTKGAPHIIRDLVCISSSPQEVERLNRIIHSKASRGLRTLGVAICDGEQEVETVDVTNQWQLLGYLSLFDPPRDDTLETIRRAKALGIDIKMITGDQQAIAIETSRQLELGTNIVGPEIWSIPRDGAFLGHQSFGDFVLTVNGFAGVFPEHKFNVVSALLKTGRLAGMTGDGVNDAPALKLATVGIAVAGATESAKLAADIQLLEPGLSAIITAFTASRKIFKRVEAYIIYRIYTSMLILMFYCSAIVFLTYEFPTWTLVLISVINDFTLMSSAGDRVPSPPLPQIWNMVRISVVSVFLAVMGTASCILFLALIDPVEINWWSGWGVTSFPASPSTVRNAYMNSCMWLYLTCLLQLTFHSARTSSFFFNYDGKRALFPSYFLISLQLISIILTIFLTVYWPDDVKIGSGSPLRGISWHHAMVTIVWAVMWFIMMDVMKVIAYKLLSIARWSDFSLMQLFTNTHEIQAEIRKQLDQLQREELNRRFEEQEITLGDKVDDQRQQLERTISFDASAYVPAATTPNLQLPMLEKRITRIEAKLNHLIKLLESTNAAQQSMNEA